MLRRLLFLQPGELGRLWPFFGLYLLVFAALTLADGVSLALFVKKSGADRLPLAYALTALANLVLIGLYLLVAERAGAVRLFHAILAGAAAAYLAAWAAVRWGGAGEGWYGLLFVSREVAFTLVLMHFGTFVQGYFTRAELNRVLPIVYAGGRVGGIVGGAALERLSGPLGLPDLALVFAGLAVVCMVLLSAVAARCRPAHAPEDDRNDRGLAPPRGGDDLEERARTSLAGFLRFAWASPLLFWNTVTSILFTVCRWALNYQYSAYFAGQFPDEEALARFLGSYTQVALAVSLAVQVFVVNRLVAWAGLKGAHLTYSALLLGGLGLNLLPVTFGTALFSRLVETELRFGLRNPVAQLLTNKFSKALRLRVRAWTFGVLTPVSTLMGSAVLAGLARWQGPAWVAGFGGLAGLGYFLASLGLCRSFREGEPPAPPAATPPRAAA